MRCATCGSTNIEGGRPYGVVDSILDGILGGPQSSTRGWWLQGNGWLIGIDKMHDSHLLNAHRLAVSVRLGLRTSPWVPDSKIQELLEEISRRGLQPIPVTDPPA